MASDYCYGIEMERALQRHQDGTARVIPIIMRPVDWHGAPFSTLQMLPTDAKPITRWPDRDEAFWDVATNIRLMIQELNNVTKTSQDKVVNSLSASKINTVENLLERSNALRDNKQYDEAIEVCDHVLRIDPSNSVAYFNKGYALNELGRYEEALAACEAAIRLNPDNSNAYMDKGFALNSLRLYEEGLAAYERAIRLDPNSSKAYNNKGWALIELGRYEEALAACDTALHLDPNNSIAQNNKKIAIKNLRGR